MQERLERLRELTLAGELETANAEVRRAADEVIASLLTSERALAVEYMKTVAKISGDATSLETLDLLVQTAAERGHLSTVDIDHFYAQAPANR